MPRKKRAEDLVFPVAQLGGLLVLLTFIFPPVRQIIVQVGAGLVTVLILIGVGLLALAIGKFVMRSRQQEFPLYELPVILDIPAAKPAIPQTVQLDRFVEQLCSIDWFQFEKVIAAVYRKLGYTVTRRGGANPDGGIHLIIVKAGERAAIQCKQWKTWNVGVRTVREFLGAMTDVGIKRGILVTLCGYTAEAKRLADKHGIKMVEETGLAKLLQATNAGCDPNIIAIIRDTRKYCPKCEAEMVLRTATKGRGAGQQFWGCSGYPKCWFTMPLAQGRSQLAQSMIQRQRTVA